MNRYGLVAFVLLLILILSGCERQDGEERSGKYKLCVNDFIFSVGDDADKVVLALGEPNYFSVAPSCAGVGNDELYVYNGFRITAHRDGKSAEISIIELTNDTLSTLEGICIGDSEDRIAEIYGNGKIFTGGIEYGRDSCCLRFFLSDGRVVGIKYIKNGE